MYPKVKRRLQEVILQRKRKDAAASMGNLKIGNSDDIFPDLLETVLKLSNPNVS